MTGLFIDLVAFLKSLDPLLVLGIEALICFSMILIMLAFFGPVGLFAYTALAIVAANIQVLKIVDLSLVSQPVALGTILFSSTFLCTDILAEYYGEKVARLCVYMGFVTFSFWVIIMLLTIGYPAASFSAQEDQAMQTLFLPVPALFVAGMTAYLISQLHDVWAFQFIRKLTNNKYLWLRNCLSTIFSGLIDNTIFSILAFVILAANPLPWDVVIYSYILGTFILRIGMSLADTPFVYLAKKAINIHETHFKTILQPQIP